MDGDVQFAPVSGGAIAVSNQERKPMRAGGCVIELTPRKRNVIGTPYDITAPVSPVDKCTFVNEDIGRAGNLHGVVAGAADDEVLENNVIAPDPDSTAANPGTSIGADDCFV